jgi:tRNA threonylcarbamoyladenosine biosynthesis protein TsaE
MHGVFESDSASVTEALAARLAAALAPGDVVVIEGELGAGKTTFVRGAARALGVSGPVTSPTFTIGQRYPVRPDESSRTGEAVPPPAAVAHLDLYRLSSLRGEDPDLLADYIAPDTIAFVEWPAAGESEIAALGHIAARVHLEHAGGDRRRLTIAPGPDGRPRA